MASRGKQVFSGAPQTVISISAATIASAYVCGNTTPYDNASDAYPFVRAVLTVGKNFASAPAANAPIGLWAVPRVDGTNYATPGSTVDGTPAAQSGAKSTYGALFLGNFFCTNVSTTQTLIIPKIAPIGFEVAKLFISNDCGVTINAGSSADLLTVVLTPWALGSV